MIGNSPETSCQFSPFYGRHVGFNTRRDHHAGGRSASCSNPWDAPVRFAIAIHAFLLPCTCLLFVRSTLCRSLVPVAKKDLAGCRIRSDLLVLVTKSCHLCFTSAYCVALSNELSTRGTGVCSGELMPTRHTSF